MSKMYTKEEIESQLSEFDDWKQQAFCAFKNLMLDTNKPYPCIFAQQGFFSNNLNFGFIEDPLEGNSIKELACLLKAYGSISRETGPYSSFIVVFKLAEESQNYTTLDYEKLFWEILDNLSEADTEEWPEGISKDPDHHSWEFCFNKEPYFCFCATPAHEARASRHFPFFMITFQPRWIFDEINGSTELGKKMQELIRKRLQKYDQIPVSPNLKWYGGEDNHEWKQYFLRDNQTALSKCPFKHLHKTKSNSH